MITVKFDKPRAGFWNGVQSGGEFQAGDVVHPGVGKLICWGCYRLNIWFWAGSGRSWREARANAIKRLKAMVQVPCTIA